MTVLHPSHSQRPLDAGYKNCLERVQPEAFHLLPAAAHATQLQAVFSQDSSAKVRRAGFYAWLALQERHQGSEDCSEWDMSVLQVVKARCMDRSGSDACEMVPRCCMAWNGIVTGDWTEALWV